uniref:Uncharacterized protein n=1 Tax=Rhizophagus irregularis (strain DAOM 181602 / DAOM 197198 / MUCL 43194) TaxID=747089 RepID=U9U0I5_RHIID
MAIDRLPESLVKRASTISLSEENKFILGILSDFKVQNEIFLQYSFRLLAIIW